MNSFSFVIVTRLSLLSSTRACDSTITCFGRAGGGGGGVVIGDDTDSFFILLALGIGAASILLCFRDGSANCKQLSFFSVGSSSPLLEGGTMLGWNTKRINGFLLLVMAMR